MRTGHVEDLEEGDACPACEEGSLKVVRGRDCSCHLNPPCISCVEDCLKCDGCGFPGRRAPRINTSSPCNSGQLASGMPLTSVQ